MNSEIIKYHRIIQQLIQDIFKSNRKLRGVIMAGDMLDQVVQIQDNFTLTVIIDLDNFVDKTYIDKYFGDKFEINAPLLIDKINQTIINYKKQTFCVNILELNVIVKCLEKSLKQDLKFKTSYS